MSLTDVLDLSVNISIPAISFNAFADLFNSSVPLLALVLIPAKLTANERKPLPIREGSCIDSFAPLIMAIESDKVTPYVLKTAPPFCNASVTP